MDEGEFRQIVGLHQREGRARHLDRGVAGKMRDHRAHQRRLARAEITRQRDEVAGLEQVREIDGETPGRLLVRQRDRELSRPMGSIASMPAPP